MRYFRATAGKYVYSQQDFFHSLHKANRWKKNKKIRAKNVLNYAENDSDKRLMWGIAGKSVCSFNPKKFYHNKKKRTWAKCRKELN